MDNTMFDKVVSVLNKMTLALAFDLLATVLQGFVFMMLWGWFISPTFDLPKLNFIQSVGVLITATMFKSPSVKYPDDQNEQIVRILKNFVYPVFILLFGLFFQLFM